jgi:hypothetical protein
MSITSQAKSFSNFIIELIQSTSESWLGGIKKIKANKEEASKEKG